MSFSAYTALVGLVRIRSVLIQIKEEIMRRWNGWGDEANTMELPESAGALLVEKIGEGKPLSTASLDEVLAQVPKSRAPEHPLLDASPETRVRHARGQSLPDWLAMHSGEFEHFPDAVAFPETTQQVRELLDFAIAKDLIVIPYGGGTSVVGHITPYTDGRPVITVAMARMNRLLDLDEASQIATFGAGANGPELEAQLAAKGYTLGHYPQSWELSTVGGWVATRSSGQQSLRYGRIEQMFAGGRIETPIGTMDIPTIPASSAGPDLREWFMGSEGRMGIITEVKVRVMPLPEKERFSVVFFPNWDKAHHALRTLVQQKVPLSMLRLSNVEETFTGVRLSVDEKKANGLDKVLALRGLGSDKCMATFGVTGSSTQCKQYRKQALKIFRQFGAVGLLGDYLGNKWEHGRFRFPYLRHPLFEMGYAVDTFETALDWNKLPDYVARVEHNVRTALGDENERVHVFTHLSHLYPQGSSAYTTYIFRCANDYTTTLKRWQTVKRIASETIVEFGGTISHQHGVGRDHAPYMPAEKGDLGMHAIRQHMAEFDPKGVMCPGVLFTDDPKANQ